MIGDLDTQTIKLYTEKLIGNVTACMGFIQCGKTYKPNTVLESNLKNYSKAPCRVIATFRKAQQEKPIMKLFIEPRASNGRTFRFQKRLLIYRPYCHRLIHKPF